MLKLNTDEFSDNMSTESESGWLFSVRVLHLKCQMLLYRWYLNSSMIESDTTETTRVVFAYAGGGISGFGVGRRPFVHIVSL
jgi:hypothetical protein